MKKIVAVLIGLLGLAQVSLAIAWMVLNYNSIPNYGDTIEYLEIASSANLPLDMYRGCVFPLILRFCLYVEAGTKVPFHHILYTIHLVYGTLATGFFCAVIYDTLGLHSKSILIAKRKWSFVALFSVLILSIPLVMHMHFSVLTDSLAASFTLAFLAASIGLFTMNARRYSGPTLIFFVLLSLTRPDRFIFASLFLLIASLAFAVKTVRCKPAASFLIKTRKQTLGTAVLVLCLATSITLVIIKMTQTQVAHRMPPALEYFMYERVVRNRLAHLYPLLPTNITCSISFEDAQFYDSHFNNYRQAVAKLVLEDSGVVERISQMNFARVNQITRLAWKSYHRMIIVEILKDIFCNLFSPFADLLAHYTPILNIDGAIGWTESRMGQSYPRITSAYLRMFRFLFLLSTLYGVFMVCARKISVPKFNNQVGFMLVLWMLISAIGYGATGCNSFHIRYTLPCYLQVVFLTYYFVYSSLGCSTQKT